MKKIVLSVLSLIAVAAYAGGKWETQCRSPIGSNHGADNLTYDQASAYCKKHSDKGHDCTFFQE